ncbi:MAG: PASTA domain-containing protein [Armatimonadetes bacterium]|nr:PASTA domain-containing protein [Armatimonadota bacterium]
MEPQSRVQAAGSLLVGLGSVILTVMVILGLVAGTVLAVFGPSAPLVTVPDVNGMPSQDAESRLKAAGLDMKVVNYEYTKDVAEGSVVEISPYAGKLVRAGREVRVVVSRGARMAKVPKLAGITLAEATERLGKEDLQVGEEERRRSDEPADIILAQDPAPGKQLPRKAKVNLVISGGKTFDEYSAGDHTYLFRTLKVIVAQGKALQLVQVDVSGDDEDKSFYERLCRPGEVVRVDLYGRRGARVRVRIEDETVFSARL